MEKIDAKLINDIFDKTSEQRTKFEYRWYLTDNFYENNHFLKALRTTGTLEKVKFPKGISVEPIPRAKKQIDTMLNLLFLNDPKWQVYPYELDEKSADNAMRLQKFFEILWNALQIKEQFRKVAFNAMKHNVGYLEVGMDEAGRLFLDRYSAYQIYHEPNIEDLDETHFLIKVVPKTINELENSKIYDQDVVKDLTPDYKYSSSEYKHIRESEKFGSQSEIKDKRLQKVLLKEVWLKDGDQWYLTTECQGKILRQPTKIDYSLTFVAVTINEGQIYQTSLLEDLIPMNKKIDIIVAYLEQFFKVCTVGRLLEPAGAKVERILDQHGERIRYQGPQPPVWLESPQLSPVVINLLQLLINFMDEKGASVMSFGKVPTGVKAWRALESLKQIEVSNLQTAIDHLTGAMEKLGYKILEIIETGAVNPIPFVYQDKNEFKQISAVSQNAYEVNYEYQSQESILPVSSKYRIKVEIEQGIAYTEEGKRQTVIELAKSGLIDKQTALESLKFSNVGEIVERSKQEAELKTMLESLKGAPKEVNPLQQI